MNQERINCIESFVYRKLCFYRFEEKLIKWVVMESGEFYVVIPGAYGMENTALSFH